MTKKPRHNSATPEDFNNAKEMMKAGLTDSQISRFGGFSVPNIYRWRRYPNWEAYCEYKKHLTQWVKNPSTRPSETKLPLVENTIPQEKTLGDVYFNLLSEIVKELHLMRIAWEKSPTQPTKVDSNNWLKDKFGINV